MKFHSIFAILFVLVSCQNSKTHIDLKAEYLYQWNQAYEEGVMNDFYNPPVASRMNAYPNLACYAVLFANDKNAIFHKIKNFPTLATQNEHKELVALYLFYEVGKKMIYSFHFLDTYEKEFRQKVKEDGYNENEINAAQNDAKELAAKYLKWVAQDNYKMSRSDTKYILKNTEGSWKPTAPDYLDALEPNWEKIRPFFIDSAAQFTMAIQPHLFNIKNKNSAYYKELMEVKEQVSRTDTTQLNIAKFWDCSPIEPRHVSHASFADKKLTPGGHWMSLCRALLQEQKKNLKEASYALALLSTSIADGFIACWDAKYFYNYIRPITAIQDNLDSKWATLIITPNFPEYPSGHSVASGVASTILNDIFGNTFSFTDKSEIPFGMEARSFPNFDSACNEAAISRFYAGIHYKKAIEDGKTMGRNIGKFILNKIE